MGFAPREGLAHGELMQVQSVITATHVDYWNDHRHGLLILGEHVDLLECLLAW